MASKDLNPALVAVEALTVFSNERVLTIRVTVNLYNQVIGILPENFR